MDKTRGDVPTNSSKGRGDNFQGLGLTGRRVSDREVCGRPVSLMATGDKKITCLRVGGDRKLGQGTKQLRRSTTKKRPIGRRELGVTNTKVRGPDPLENRAQDAATSLASLIAWP